jgi:hypothetical protein
MTRDEKNAYHRKYYRKNRDRILETHKKYRKRRSEYIKQYYLKNRAKLLARQIQYTKDNPKIRQNARIQRKYGITLQQYNQMRRDQEGRCKLCGRKRKLVLDHCHTTGRIRGFLCIRCNGGLGAFGDSIEGLKKAIKYLSQ